ncbi:NAD(P)H-binding protein [Microlunatus spumicola]|uniref:NAD(P)H-binding protein n=1 Tax=Microlunatus spumicola TaxID=81499 RepID=A0ABP6XGX8_9ACTN
MTTPTAPVLLLGGTGRTGRRVADRLRAHGRPVRTGSRRGDPPFAWDEPGGWDALLAGTQAAYVAYAPDLALPEAEGQLRRLGAAAADAGLERLVLLSGRGEPAAARSEAALREGGCPVAVVRSSWFAQDFSEHFLLGPVLEGVVALPTAGRPEVAEGFVDVDDVADVVTALLLRPDPSAETVELSGPALVTFAEAATLIARATGRPLAYVPLDVDGFVAGAVAGGVPPEEARPLGQLFAEVLDGRNEHLTDGVARVLGRPPRAFADVVRDLAATGVWDLDGTAVAS